MWVHSFFLLLLYYYNPLEVHCCPKHEYEEWHKKDCLPDEFSNCGVEKLHRN